MSSINAPQQKTLQQQDSGNHPAATPPKPPGADKFGGTRKGAENVEETAEQPGAASR